MLFLFLRLADQEEIFSDQKQRAAQGEVSAELGGFIEIHFISTG